jgi:hypothetical protein
MNTPQLQYSTATVAPYTLWTGNQRGDDVANFQTARVIQSRNPGSRIFDNIRRAFVVPTTI